jgi:hypothetical protein
MYDATDDPYMIASFDGDESELTAIIKRLISAEPE